VLLRHGLPDCPCLGFASFAGDGGVEEGVEGVDVGVQAFVFQLLDEGEDLVEVALLAPEVDAIVDLPQAAAAVEVLVLIRAAVGVVLVVVVGVGVGSEGGRATGGGGGACPCCCHTLGVEYSGGGGGRGTADDGGGELEGRGLEAAGAAQHGCY
jgi:hypothetical protein